jgi:hypothetical protein
MHINSRTLPGLPRCSSSLPDATSLCYVPFRAGTQYERFETGHVRLGLLLEDLGRSGILSAASKFRAFTPFGYAGGGQHQESLIAL